MPGCGRRLSPSPRKRHLLAETPPRPVGFLTKLPSLRRRTRKTFVSRTQSYRIDSTSQIGSGRNSHRTGHRSSWDAGTHRKVSSWQWFRLTCLGWTDGETSIVAFSKCRSALGESKSHNRPNSRLSGTSFTPSSWQVNQVDLREAQRISTCDLPKPPKRNIKDPNKSLVFRLYERFMNASKELFQTSRLAVKHAQQRGTLETQSGFPATQIGLLTQTKRRCIAVLEDFVSTRLSNAIL